MKLLIVLIFVIVSLNISAQSKSNCDDSIILVNILKYKEACKQTIYDLSQVVNYSDSLFTLEVEKNNYLNDEIARRDTLIYERSMQTNSLIYENMQMKKNNKVAWWITACSVAFSMLAVVFK